MKKSLFLFLLICFVGVGGTQNLGARTFTMTEVAAAPSTIDLQEGDVVTISTKEELFAFAKFANSVKNSVTNDVYGELEGITYLLMENIDVEGDSWTIVGSNYNTSFNGIFDGQGYSISNLNIDGNFMQVGLFGYVGDTNKKGCVKNLCAENIRVNNTSSSRSSMTAGLIAYLNYSDVLNCYISGSVYGTGIVGGIVGCGINSKIENCCNTATLEVKSTGTCAGGIIGKITKTDVYCSYNAGTVSYRGSSYGDAVIGALCGESLGNNGTLSQCFFLPTTIPNAYPGASDTQNSLYSRTEAQFASGQVAYELSVGNPGTWGQWLTPGVYQDLYPVFYDAEKHPEVVADADLSGTFINDGFPVVYYSAALPAGDNIFYPRGEWHDAVATRLSAHPNELAFADAAWEDLAGGSDTSEGLPAVDNLVSRTDDGLGWECAHLVVTDRTPIHSPFSLSVRRLTYDRQLYKDGGYESWYFPLDIPVTQLPAGYNFEMYDGQDLASNTVSFIPLQTDVEKLSADTPYLLKYVGEDRWPSASDIRLQWEDVTWPASDELQHADVTSETGFYGSLLGQTAADGNEYLFTIATHGQSLSTLAAGKTLNPFRCYFYHSGGGASRISVLHRDINSLETVASDGRFSPASPVYDLQGRPVSEKSSVGITLRHGKAIIKK